MSTPETCYRCGATSWDGFVDQCCDNCRAAELERRVEELEDENRKLQTDLKHAQFKSLSYRDELFAKAQKIWGTKVKGLVPPTDAYWQPTLVYLSAGASCTHEQLREAAREFSADSIEIEPTMEAGATSSDMVPALRITLKPKDHPE